MLKHLALLSTLAALVPVPAAAQEAAAASGNPSSVCGAPLAPPTTLPPGGSGPVVWLIVPCFEAQGNVTLVDPQTYLYYMQLKPSTPSTGNWVPYTEQTEATILADFHRLYDTKFLDNILIDVQDYTFANGVVGKIVVYNLEERQRVKIVDFTGSKKIDARDRDTRLRESGAEIRLDTFIDTSLIRKVEGIVRDMLREKGFQFATVRHEINTLPGGPKLVNVTFQMDEGPKVKIRDIEFEGNRAVSDRALRRRMKDNKEEWFLSFITKRGTYQENKFEEDAERVMEYYRDRGYITAQVGAPELQYLEDSANGDTRWVQLRIPVVEGNRYRVGDVSFEGNTLVKGEVLRPLFELTPGEYYSQKKVRKGFEKAQELYGAAGYFEFTGYPDPQPRDLPNPADPQAPAALAAPAPAERTGPAIADITIRLQEGKQYFVNRITFVGNTTTRDSVIRREMRLYENGVFDTEALKQSIRRINQLGYFKALEGPGRDVTIDKLVTTENKVDLNLQFEEQNRNQLTFGAGVSQFEGVFGQLSFQTANFLGRGESLTVSMQGGQRAQNYQLAFTEPFLFDRNLTAGISLFNQEVRYISQFTQKSSGGVITLGFPLGRGFTRVFTNYSYEQVRVTEISDIYTDPAVLARNPFLRDSLLIGQDGQRIISKVTPTLLYNTVDQPIFPTTGKRLSASVSLAGLGGNTRFVKPTIESVWFMRQNTRMSLGVRAQYEYIRGIGGTTELPIFEKLFLGGEYSIRGFDIRTVGPQDPATGLVLGGNKSLLFNVEQLFTIAPPVRLILFYDAGQVQPGPERLADGTFRSGGKFALNDFKTSTGAEIRFFMPVLNVPFRLIFAYNPQREGVLDNQLRPQKEFQFRFAVGTTF